MSLLHLADNTVLVNFASIGRLDLLQQLFNGRGGWSATVKLECEVSAEIAGLEELASVVDFMDVTYTLDSDDEIVATAAIRERLRIPGDHATKHLGESETLAIISCRGLDANIVTDDTGARREARRLAVPSISTASLLLLAVRVKFISPEQCWEYLETLHAVPNKFLPDAPATWADLLARCGLIE